MTIEDAIKNVEDSIAALRKALEMEQIINPPDSQNSPEQVSNQSEKTIEQLSAEFDIRF